MEHVVFEVKKLIVGQDMLLERLIVALLARGHVLVEGVPGLAKTLAIKTVAQTIGVDFQRIQFTPDLVPADLIGTRIYNQRLGEFQTSLGPVHTNLLLADEINRAPAKVQSALLEVMQERQVTIGRETHRVGDPFLVMATQNPIESEGTYPLPEAQLDRFMLKVLVDYPTPTEEFVIVERMTTKIDPPQQVIGSAELLQMQQAADAVYVDSALMEYAVRVVNATRNPTTVGLHDLTRYVTFGASPRASINMILSAKALAFLRGRTYALPQDVTDLALDVLRHRIVLSYEALADNISADSILTRVLAAVPVPVVPLRESPVAYDDTIFRPDPERLLRRLEWRVIRRLDGSLQGDYRTMFRGAGLDAADLREYVPGDDVRHIDWNVTARTDVTHVRTFLEDRELTAWLLLDRSPSMSFGPTERPKEAVLIEVAIALARVLTRGGNRVGAILHNNAIERMIPPRNGRMQVLRLAHDLLRPAPNSGGTTDLKLLIEAGASVLRRRSLVFVISDFISEPGWEQAMARLTERHEVVAIRLVDPGELELPDAGWIVVEDVETGELLSVDTSDPEFRRRFGEAAAAREAEVRELAKQAGTPLYEVSTEDDLVRALVRMVESRKRQRR